ncbi:indolepyruvate ferredoxin oxidoreductase family protein [Modestobacter lapidis]|nr:indolepyruvate ferredoxin oxidoreductase family protein [Modestobacter lapidis]
MPAVSLEDSYARTSGQVFLTGIQAIVRGLIDQARLDRAAGLRTGTMISGYPGSPLGGLDVTLERAARQLRPLDIHHVPGVNEELAASVVMGSQMLDFFPPGGFDGVTGVWYGKAPGVDRAGDVFRHGNFSGTPAGSGAVVLCGDDPTAKSSTLPTQSEYALLNAGIPVLYPASVAEVRSLVMQAIALSRYAGIWVGLKLVTNVCDGGAVVDLDATCTTAVTGPATPGAVPFQKQVSFSYGPQAELERTLVTERLPAAQRHVRANQLDRVSIGEDDRLGLLAAGKTWTDVATALRDLGFDGSDRERLGVRLYKPALIYPLDDEPLLRFAAGLEEVVVIEEKRPFIESQVKEILYGRDGAPRVVGKRDTDGSPLLAAHGELDADSVTVQLAPRLRARAVAAGRDDLVDRIDRRVAALTSTESVGGAPSVPMRMPNYCSGCPHNRSTLAVDGVTAGGGIGCHGMAGMMTQPERQILSMVPMGSEGATWIGAAPFTARKHFLQNIGDGTFFHSGIQALRAAIAADVDITYRLLWNKAVAMTGGQDVVADIEVPALTRSLEAMGVRRTIVVAEEPERYRGLGRLAGNATLRSREDYEDSVRELSGIPGVTVLVFDQQCAAEKRRLRKRGRLAAPTKYVVINESVCEGCGDCGQQSNCPSVQPVETEFGRKTQIEQSSCNADYSCLSGDCPSFLTVYSEEGPAETGRVAELPAGLDTLPEPARLQLPDPFHAYLPGVGGTGVTTANQLLAYAALIEGKQAITLDQTGLAQKGGAVLSTIVISDEALSQTANRVGRGCVDLLLAADAVTAVQPPHLDRCAPDRTHVVANLDVIPTGAMIRDVHAAAPDPAVLRDALAAASTGEGNHWVAAGTLAQRFFGDHMATNLILIGAAYQAGLLPLAARSIEDAIAVNGVAVERTTRAFRLGRMAVAHPERLAAPAAAAPAGTDGTELDTSRRWPAASRNAERHAELLGRCAGLDEDSRRLLDVRIADLIGYQDARYAATYVDTVLAVAEREAAVVPGRRELTRAVARQLYKLMAYKDEYEVPRLLLQSEWNDGVLSRFGPSAKMRYNLHPPLLRSLGMDRKIELGPWARPLLRALVGARRLRGTPLDPFGRTTVRRTERELIRWYRDLVAETSESLRSYNHGVAVAVAEIPDMIRGYEHIKLDNVEQARRQAEDLRRRMRALPLTAA